MRSYKIVVEQKRIYLELGENIRRFRKKATYTQVRLSKDAGISRASLANIEAGRQQVLVHHLYTIAHALQLDSPDQLLPTVPSREHREVLSSPIPVSGEDLTDSQRNEVIHLISQSSNK